MDEQVTVPMARCRYRDGLPDKRLFTRLYRGNTGFSRKRAIGNISGDVAYYRPLAFPLFAQIVKYLFAVFLLETIVSSLWSERAQAFLGHSVYRLIDDTMLLIAVFFIIVYVAGGKKRTLEFALTRLRQVIRQENNIMLSISNNDGGESIFIMHLPSLAGERMSEDAEKTITSLEKRHLAPTPIVFGYDIQPGHIGRTGIYRYGQGLAD